MGPPTRISLRTNGIEAFGGRPCQDARPMKGTLLGNSTQEEGCTDAWQ
jgi:hypothetical protein